MAELVDLMALDTAVLEFLGGRAPDADAALARDVYDAVSRGDAQRALERLQDGAPALLEDDRLLFKLRRQQFIELAQSGDPARTAQAIALAKKELAPLALHAYPEAYAEFKGSMLSLLHSPANGSSGSSPGGAAAAGAAAAVTPGRSAAAALADAAAAGRQQLAGMLYRTIRESLGVRDPAFTVALRYLLLVHAEHAQPARPARPAAAAEALPGQSARDRLLARLARWPHEHGEAAPASAPAPAKDEAAPSEADSEKDGENDDVEALCQGLLLGERDPAPLPNDSARPASALPESHVQALRTSLGCDREEAVALLRQAGGSKSGALRNAVQAGRLDEAAVVQLAQDYALFRGLDVPLPPSPLRQPAAQAQQPALLRPASVKAMDTDEEEQPGGSLGSPTEQPAAKGVSGAAAAAAAAVQACSLREASAAGVGDPGEAEADSGQAPPAKIARAGGRRSPKDLHPCPSAAADSRGSGPPAGAYAATGGASSEQQQQQQQGNGSGDGAAAGPDASDEVQGSRGAAAGPGMSERQVHGLVAQLRGLLEAGCSEQVEEQLRQVTPSFCDDHPEATFLVRRCSFLRLLLGSGGPSAAGEPSRGGSCPTPAQALAFARAQLSPLAQEHPELQPLLKSSLAELLPASRAGSSGAGKPAGGSACGPAEQLREAAADAAAAVHAALRQMFQLEAEPRLLRLLGHLLVTHSMHFMEQRMKDGFEAELGIPALRAPGAVAEAERRWRAQRASRPPPASAAGPSSQAARAAALEEGLFGQMGPIFRQLRHIAADLRRPLEEARRIEAEARAAARAAMRAGAAGEAYAEPAGVEAGYVAAEPPALEGGGGEEEEGSDEEVMLEVEEEEEDEGEEGVGSEEAGGGGGGEGGEGGPSEEAILLTQEFSGLPRGQAIELLLVLGSPQAVMAHLFP